MPGSTSRGGTSPTTTSWVPATPPAGTPWGPVASAAGPVEPQIIPVVWPGRTSTEDSQDPTLSLPRQLKNSRAALPPGCVIVGHFYDVESGRLDLDQRGRGTAHQAFNIPIPRDGGIADLLEEADRPDRRFVAVICESIERVARRTYFGTKIEYQLERAGVTLWAADEPINAAGGAKRATPTLTRRVKQAVAEWYVLQMLELSWDGLSEHTRQGWNIGKPPYGYLAERIPHPVAARRAEGRTKHRLVPDPERGHAVTAIYQWRAVERLGYRSIAERLNADPESFPPPEPTRSGAALGRWTGSAVREVLTNPKYTGYMVWNRRSTKDKLHPGKLNPRAEWVWSPQPVHEPLVTRDLFDAVTADARSGQGSRGTGDPARHPRTKRSYLLRSFVVCDVCERTMTGVTRRGNTAYYACKTEPHQHRDAAWFADHPRSIYVREDAIAEAVHAFFADRIFGPQRRDLLEADLSQAHVGCPAADPTQVRRGELEEQIGDLQRRRHRLITELEEAGDITDADLRQQFRGSIQERFAELGRQQQALQTQVDALGQPNAQHAQPQATDLLDQLPLLTTELGTMPPALQRRLYDAYRLKIRYSRARHAITLHVTVTADALPTLTATAQTIQGATSADPAPNDVALVLCAPGGI
jgi:site-specific DNA recombinase